MSSYCTQCGITLHSLPDGCPSCAAAAAPIQWGLWPVAWGVMALVPTALLVATSILVMPLAVATVVSAVVLGALQVALAWLLTMRTWPPSLPVLGLKRPDVSLVKAALLALAAIICSLGFAQLYTMAVTALGWEILSPPELPSDLLLPGYAAILSVLALAVLTPIAEEIFFRGFVQRGLVNRWGPVSGLIVSAAVFSGLHFSPEVLLPVFVTGLLLGALYWRTGSLWPCVAVHAAQNLAAVLTIMLEL